MKSRSVACVIGFCVAALALAACNGNGTSPGAPPLSGAPLKHGRHGSGSTSPIQHVVMIVQENRSFNDFFATYPGGDGTTTGMAVTNTGCSPAIYGGPIALTEVPLVVPQDMNHSWKSGYSIANDDAKMDAFDLVQFGGTGPYECSYPYQYTDPSDIAPYWTLASEYTLAEHMFTTQGSDSFSAHQDLIRGGTIVEPKKAMVDIPSDGSNWWGCDAPHGTITHLVNATSTKFIKKGPFPCSNKFKSSYPTLADLMDAKGVSWKYYVPPANKIYGKLLSAFDLVYGVRYGSDWKNDVITPETQILDDVQNGKLADVSWVIPEEDNSDHPGTNPDDGPEWVATVVNAIGESSYWSSTAIVIVWDDWGGIYDNEGYNGSSYGGPGERVPAIVVSPYAKPGYISTTTYQFGSILAYIEDNWDLGNLGTTDKTSTPITDCFNYNQKPITFQPIPSSLGKSYFMHEKHSYRPPDDDW